MEYLQVFITVPDRRTAARISRVLLAERRAACVQVLGPVASSYHWQGRVEHSREWLCIVKTGRRHYRALERRVRQLHPYEVPEIIALPVSTGYRQYLEWLAGELKPVKPQVRSNRG
ncbi:MAG: divalent-cation tolerance protein CutA [candidate division WOR-3 bacterium]|jgi:periplasmic divalent cation tolerance protein